MLDKLDELADLTGGLADVISALGALIRLWRWSRQWWI